MDKLNQYILEHTSPEDELLKKIDRVTNLKAYHPRMLSGHLQGKLLEMFCRMINPKNVLEIGTYTGYSAICIARGMRADAKLITIEINDELEALTRSFFDESDVTNKIDFRIGDAIEIIPKLNREFDMIFIDGDKSKYIEYYRLAKDKINKGGFILADNVLWSGKVIADKLRDNDYFTHGIKAFNEFVQKDSEVKNVLFPFRDGMMVVQKL